MAENPAQLRGVQRSFHEFFEGWLLQLHKFLHQLLTLSLLPHSPSNIDQHKALIDRVLSHYQQYFDEKSRLANLDVFLLFSPTWLSSYDRTLLWIADYKPALILRLIDGAVQGLTAEQKQSLEKLKNEITRKERLVTETMATLQESVAGPSVLKLARRVGKLSDGDISELDSAIEVVKGGEGGFGESLRASSVDGEESGGDSEPVADGAVFGGGGGAVSASSEEVGFAERVETQITRNRGV